MKKFLGILFLVFSCSVVGAGLGFNPFKETKSEPLPPEHKKTPPPVHTLPVPIVQPQPVRPVPHKPFVPPAQEQRVYKNVRDNNKSPTQTEDKGCSPTITICDE